MRTIEFSNDDIKECKLALVNQNLTSLQSAFLIQYITNFEQALIDIRKICNYFANWDEGDNITITCDFLDNAECVLQIIDKVLGDEK